MCLLKCSLCLLPLPKESPGYTVLTDVCLALSSKKKSYSLFRQRSRFVSPKNFTPYWAPKDVKSSSISDECFARFNKFGLHEFHCKDAKTYRHNYSTQTLSSNSWHVAWISQVNKAYDEHQMVSISKLYLTLRKKLIYRLYLCYASKKRGVIAWH